MAARTRILAALCTVLGAVVWLETTRALSSTPGTGSAPAVPPPLPEPPHFAPPPLYAFDAVALRPLFAASRRPAEAPPTVEPPAPPPQVPPLAARLLGITIAGAARAALVAPAAHAHRWLHEGDRLDGWRLETIEHDRVHLRAGAETTLLRLRPGR